MLGLLTRPLDLHFLTIWKRLVGLMGSKSLLKWSINNKIDSFYLAMSDDSLDGIVKPEMR